MALHCEHSNVLRMSSMAGSGTCEGPSGERAGKHRNASNSTKYTEGGRKAGGRREGLSLINQIDTYMEDHNVQSVSHHVGAWAYRIVLNNRTWGYRSNR